MCRNLFAEPMSDKGATALWVSEFFRDVARIELMVSSFSIIPHCYWVIGSPKMRCRRFRAGLRRVPGPRRLRRYFKRTKKVLIPADRVCATVPERSTKSEGYGESTGAAGDLQWEKTSSSRQPAMSSSARVCKKSKQDLANSSRPSRANISSSLALSP